MKHIKTVKSKGRTYLYFNTGERSGEGRRVYAALPAAKSPEFKQRYAALVSERQWRETAPATIGQLFTAYHKSAAHDRLSRTSREHYLMVLRPLWLHAGDKLIDALTTEDCAALAGHHGGQATRTAFFKGVTRLYNWARRERFSELHESPAECLVFRRPRVAEWIYFIGSGPDDPVKIGRARDIAQRLHNIQSGNPLPLRLLASFLSDKPAVDERNLHHKFHAHRMNGEWFRSHPDIWAEIEGLQS